MQYLPLDFNAVDSFKPLHLDNVTQHVILMQLCYALGNLSSLVAWIILSSSAFL